MNVVFEADSIGLHRVENSSTVNPAVSMHLYSPPFSSCSVFNKQTGQRSTSVVTFWSKYGERRNRVRFVDAFVIVQVARFVVIDFFFLIVDAFPNGT